MFNNVMDTDHRHVQLEFMLRHSQNDQRHNSVHQMAPLFCRQSHPTTTVNYNITLSVGSDTKHLF